MLFSFFINISLGSQSSNENTEKLFFCGRDFKPTVYPLPLIGEMSTKKSSFFSRPPLFIVIYLPLFEDLSRYHNTLLCTFKFKRMFKGLRCTMEQGIMSMNLGGLPPFLIPVEPVETFFVTYF